MKYIPSWRAFQTLVEFSYQEKIRGKLWHSVASTQILLIGVLARLLKGMQVELIAANSLKQL